MKYPKYLYHYTSIESLAYILDTRLIKFNRLDKVDDMLDGKTSDVQNINKYYFVSSWTSDNTESISMWNMYTPNMKGVRLCLGAFPFEYRDAIDNNILCHEEIISKNNQVYALVYPVNFKISKDMVHVFDPKEDFLKKVIYRSKHKDNFPDYFNVTDEDSIGISLSTIGVQKKTYWSFQKEWRYIFYFLPKVL